MHKLDWSKSGYVFVDALTLSLQKRDTDDDIRLRKHEYVDFTKWLNTFDMLVPRLKKSSIDQDHEGYWIIHVLFMAILRNLNFKEYD